MHQACKWLNGFTFGNMVPDSVALCLLIAVAPKWWAGRYGVTEERRFFCQRSPPSVDLDGKHCLMGGLLASHCYDQPRTAMNYVYSRTHSTYLVKKKYTSSTSSPRTQSIMLLQSISTFNVPLLRECIADGLIGLKLAVCTRPLAWKFWVWQKF